MKKKVKNKLSLRSVATIVADATALLLALRALLAALEQFHLF